MRCVAPCLAVLLCLLAVGCQPKPAPNAAELKERAAALAKQVREVMTAPSMMQLEYKPPRAELGLRGTRQREAALPYMRKLVACGQAAEEPLWKLIDDDDESVRRSCVMLLGFRAPWKDEEENKIESQTILQLNIPVLERALTAKDATVRFYACGNLADCMDFSEECLERVGLSLPKLRELRNDGDPEVRGIGWTASNSILAKLSTRAKTPEGRKAATDEWERLQREKKW